MMSMRMQPKTYVWCLAPKRQQSHGLTGRPLLSDARAPPAQTSLGAQARRVLVHQASLPRHSLISPFVCQQTSVMASSLRCLHPSAATIGCLLRSLHAHLAFSISHHVCYHARCLSVGSPSGLIKTPSSACSARSVRSKRHGCSYSATVYKRPMGRNTAALALSSSMRSVQSMTCSGRIFRDSSVLGMT